MPKSDAYFSQMQMFMRTHCLSPCHYCATGAPLPIDARQYRTMDVAHLRKKGPCKYYEVGKGCIHPKHPTR